MKKVAFFLLVTIWTLSNAFIVFADVASDRKLTEIIHDVVKQGPDKQNFQIDAATLALWIKEKRNNFQVIDVRVGEKAEEQYKQAHIPGAMYIPYNELFRSDNLKKLDKTKTIIVVCHMGASEELVIVPLRMIGFNARALLLGMSGWQKNYTAQAFVKQLMETANKGKFSTESSK